MNISKKSSLFRLKKIGNNLLFALSAATSRFSEYWENILKFVNRNINSIIMIQRKKKLLILFSLMTLQGIRVMNTCIQIPKKIPLLNGQNKYKN